MNSIRTVLLLATAALSLACRTTSAPSTPAPSPSAEPISIYGTVTDLETGKPAEGVCVTLGRPGSFCWATTDRNGNYYIDGAGVIQASQTEWELYFAKPGTYPVQPSGRFRLTGGRVHVDAGLRR